MKNSLHSIFTIINAEILFNSKRVAPYLLIILFAANALFWWAAGPARSMGWATNSDYFIARMYGGFLFLTAPFFVAMMMGDPIARDYRFQMDALILSKPIHRLEYVLGKFLGSYLVLLVCCAAFGFALFLSQAIILPGIITMPFRVTPYYTLFLMLVVVSTLVYSAFFFMIGTLSRSGKAVYGSVVACYALYLPTLAYFQFRAPELGKMIDPLRADWINSFARGLNSESLNNLVLTFDGTFILNRLITIGIAIVFLLIAYWRLPLSEASRGKKVGITSLNLSLPTRSSERLYHEVAVVESKLTPPIFGAVRPTAHESTSIQLPEVTIFHEGRRNWMSQFVAAVVAEFRLLRAERSLVFLFPLVVLICVLQLAPLRTAPAYRYATDSAESLLLLLIAVAVFYTGESFHRDQELRVDGLLWSSPAQNSILLLPKLTAVLLMLLSLAALGTITSLMMQIYNGSSVGLLTYLKIWLLLVVPGLVFIASLSLSLNILLREKYVVYACSLSLGCGLFYLYSQGNLHWSYNPLLYRLWNNSQIDTTILAYRGYWLAMTLFCLIIALRQFRRRSQ